MPIFEYHCQECQETFERLVLRPQASPVITCPHCSSTQTTKLFSTFCAQGSTASAAAGTNPMGFR